MHVTTALDTNDDPTDAQLEELEQRAIAVRWRRFSSIDRLLGVADQRFDPWSRLVLGAYRSGRRG